MFTVRHHAGVESRGPSYADEATLLVGTEALAAALFEPNVPDFIGGGLGVLAWPIRQFRLMNVGPRED